jgi:hypothetical protein
VRLRAAVTRLAAKAQVKDRSVVVNNLLFMLLLFFMHSFVNNSRAVREEL